jgi:hypothetical protein
MFRVESERRPVLVRLPVAVKRWLEDEALRNGRSQSSEAAQLLRTCMDNELKKATG